MGRGTVERFDAIVVGAGPAGSAAALSLASKGFSTLLVERGRSPGVKGMFGGRIYSWALHDLVPDWAKDCPVERYVVHENMAFLTEDTALTISFDSPKLGQGRSASFTALRAKFDGWLAKKAQEAGAVLVTGIRVDGLWQEDGRIRGVLVAPNDRVAADVVVIAEGATSVLTRSAGLKADLEPREVSIGVKETIEVPAETIQERFGLGDKEGAAFVFAGQASLGLRGGGFLSTNQSTISLGLVVSSEDLAREKVEIQEVQTRFRMHPAVQRWIRGGKVTEYSAHLVPELGAGMMPRLWGDGVLVAGDAAGFLINNGYTFRDGLPRGRRHARGEPRGLREIPPVEERPHRPGTFPACAPLHEERASLRRLPADVTRDCGAPVHRGRQGEGAPRGHRLARGGRGGGPEVEAPPGPPAGGPIDVSAATPNKCPLRILVCIKQVPKAQELQVDPVTQTLKRVGVPSEINPPDANAL